MGVKTFQIHFQSFFVGAETYKIQFRIFLLVQTSISYNFRFFLLLPNHIRYNFNFFEPNIRYNFFLLVPIDKERVDEPKEDLLITILAQNQVK